MRGSRIGVSLGLWALLAVSHAGCGESPRGPVTSDGGADAGSVLEGPELVGARSGSRLRVRALDGGDGALIVVGLYDTSLAVECDIAPATDGRYRCLPGALQVDAAASFSDAACTRPAFVRPACAPAGGYVVGQPRALPTCGDVAALPVYEVGGVVEGRTVYLGPECEPVPVEEGMVVVELGREVDPETFVGAELTPLEGGRLAPYAFVADDGAVLAVSIWDRELDAECRAGGEPTALECLPSERAYAVPPRFADDRCSGARVAVEMENDGRPCARPSAAFDPLSRDAHHDLARLGDEHTGPTFTGTDSACEPSSTTGRAYVVGAPFAAGDFAGMTVVSDGTGRIRATRAASAEGEPLSHATTWLDTETSAECHPVLFADGYRCISGYGVAGLYFSDAACATTIVLRDASGGPPPMAALRHRPTDACDVVEADAVYAVGAPVAPDAVFVRGGDGICRSHVPLPDSYFYALGAEIDAPRLDLR